MIREKQLDWFCVGLVQPRGPLILERHYLQNILTDCELNRSYCNFGVLISLPLKRTDLAFYQAFLYSLTMAISSDCD